MIARWLPALTLTGLPLFALATAGVSLAAKAVPSASTSFDESKIPPSGSSRPLQKALVSQSDLASGAKLLVIEQRSLPVVHLRVVFPGIAAANKLFANEGSGGSAANVLAELIRLAGAGPDTNADKIDALGTELTTDVGMDRTVFSMSVTSDKFDSALKILARVVTEPLLPAGEFAKIKARELDRVKQSLAGRGLWLARMQMYRVLFAKEPEYREVDSLPTQIEKLTLDSVKALYQNEFTARNTLIVVSGDVDTATASSKVETAFGKLAPTTRATMQAPTAAATEPAKPKQIVYLVARPGSKQADVLLAMKGVSRTADTFFDQALAADTLGGGMSSRLFTDVREKRSLAYSTSAGLREFASGETLFSLYAGTQTDKAPNSLDALLENWKAFTSKKPSDASELQIAQKSLETSFLFRLETVGAIANLAIDKFVLHLPGADVYDYVQKYRASITAATLKDVDSFETASMSKWQPTIVVAGDPKLKTSLRRFGTVIVIDPEKDFAKIDEVAANPNEPLPAPVSSAKPK
jgi:predicted Zn-dependent peptidase